MMNAQARWRFAAKPYERNTLVLCGTGDYRLDGIPLAFGGDKPGTALASLAEINSRRIKLGLAEIVITNTALSEAR